MRRTSGAALFCLSCLLAPLAVAEDVIHVAYSERPPYMITQADGTPSGLTGTPAANAFRHAGIPVAWHRVPTNRQLMMVRDSGSKTCAVGWLWREDRRAFAKYTKPIYRDRGWIVLANAAFAARGIASLAELRQHNDIRILVKENYSYGAELDEVLGKWQPAAAVSTAATGKMVQSISKGAVDLMFMSEDEARYIMSHHPEQQTRSLRLLQFKDMPRGADRHLMCSKAVPDDVIARLNKAITVK